MKKLTIAFAALAMLAGTAYASKEHCVTRSVVANYANGTLVSTQCFSHESGYKTPKPEKECEYKR